MKKFLFLFLFISLQIYSFSQDVLGGKVSGYVELNGAYYLKDSIIGAIEVDEKFRNNNFMNLIYTNDAVEIGMRYELYQKPLLGYDPLFAGQGIPYRYFTFRSDIIDITAGNFYEQFGSGAVMRVYEERNLGIDNTIDGVRFKFRPINGLQIIGLYGKSRKFWEMSDGIVRGADLVVNFNDILGFQSNQQYTLGASAVSRFQEDNNSTYKFPENVLNYSVRANVIGENFSTDIEYVQKINDPSATNQFSYNEGRALKFITSYFNKGFSLSVNSHYLDNMDFRVDRDALLLTTPLNFIPPLSKQQTYLLATIFPYATQINSEMGFSIDGSYLFERNSLIGGQYGASLNMYASLIHNLDTTKIDQFKYDSPFLGFGDSLNYREINIEFNKKFTKDFKTSFTYINSKYNRDIVEGKDYGYVYSNIFVAEGTYQFNPEMALRLEFQTLLYDDDGKIKENTDDTNNGTWISGLAELTVSPHYYFTLINQSNLTNKNPDLREHYPTINMTYVVDALRFSFGYSRIRGGLLCVGGVCRQVPASNGFNFNLSTSF